MLYTPLVLVSPMDMMKITNLFISVALGAKNQGERMAVMQLHILFRDSHGGLNKMIISEDESIVFRYGKIRRIPPDKDAVVNSVPIKSITSVKMISL